MTRVHGTCVEVAGCGLLLRGAPGSGKSDLALRLIDGGGRLVADDQCLLARAGRSVVVTPPGALAGRLEVRGLGIVEVPSVASAPLRALIDLVAPSAVARLPAAEEETVLDVRLPLFRVAPFEAAAAAKVRLAARRLLGSVTIP